MKAETFIHKEMPSYIELIRKLTSIPAPSGKEEQRAAFVLEFLRSWGYDQAYVDAAGSVICRLEGVSAGKAHFYGAHLDTVFPDEAEIPVTVTEDRIMGPGVGDDTTNVCALLLCMKYLKQEALLPKMPVVFIFDTGEEGLGNLKGARQMMKDHEAEMAQFVSFDLGYDKIYNVAVGSRRFEIRLMTEGGHSYNDFGHTNAIAKAAEMIHDLYEIDASLMPGKTTYNVGVISGGTSVNTIAQKASFMYEYRSDSQEGLGLMAEAFEKILSHFEAMEDVDISLRHLGDRPSQGPVDPKALADLTDLASSVITEVTGKRPVCTSGSTDCNMPLSLGIPAICFGACLDIGPHTREEYVPLDSLKPGFLCAISFMLRDLGID